MKDVEQRAAAKNFAEFWKNKGYEKGMSQPFWISLLRDVFGVENPEAFISFENQVMLDHTSFIDGYIESTHVLVEQKSIGKNLRAAIKQSDGTMLTPLQQAKRYSIELPYDKRPRWIVLSNFESFLVFDMMQPNGEGEEILLKDLPKEYYRLNFLVKQGDVHLQKEMELSMQAGELVGKLYDSLSKQYKDLTNPKSTQSLNKLCVRLVFCLYAEDAGIFGGKDMFHDYMEQFDAKAMRSQLIELFRVLDQKPEDRDPYLRDDLAAFPYVNGGLFADENIEIPNFTEDIRSLLLEKASMDFDWSGISPTIFGAVFESTLNPETRRKGGMHYTSIENIHKVIDPLFLDELKAEFEQIKEVKVKKTKEDKLRAFQDKLAGLKFLDPAAGSGNFLTETYISLRKLENEIFKELFGVQIILGELANPIKVGIHQFYGIEINDFAVTVAKTALWIAESQMMKETEDIIHMSLDFLPLKTNANIHEGNALTIDWNNVAPKSLITHVLGNPPFVGASMMDPIQKRDAVAVFGKIKLSNSIDYVGAWYFKAIEYINGTTIRCAFVSTNSITQGEQVGALWGPLYSAYPNLKIDFAWRTFKWNSEANEKAAVHCVIIGFSIGNNANKRILFLDDKQFDLVDNISPYLLDSPTVLVKSQSKPLCNVPKMMLGNKPADGGNLILSAEEREVILKSEPNLEKYILQYIGAEEYINKKIRYCFWLKNCVLSDLRKSKILYERLQKVRDMRLKSTAKPTQEKAVTPHLFFFISQPDTNYLLIPSTSSEKRRYIPIGFLDPHIIASNSSTIVPNATLYHFGILTSNVHMAWMRTVAGRLEMRYRYSNAIVYNNFPWPNLTETQKAKIEKTAQAILDARAKYPDSSLADLYDEITMPPELRKAHQANDRAVMEAYGFWGKLNTESECVAELMKLYQKLAK